MIVEIAVLKAKPGAAEQLRDGLCAARPVIARATGYRGSVFYQGVEEPESFILRVEWETLAPASDPGTAFGYSNLGYVVAGLMLEVWTGKSWETLMKEFVRSILFLTMACSCARSSPETGRRPGPDAGQWDSASRMSKNTATGCVIRKATFLEELPRSFQRGSLNSEAPGRRKGLVVQAAPGSAFAMIGLIPGDRVLVLDGMGLDSPDKALEAYGRLKQSSVLTATFERAGRIRETSCQVR